MSGPVLGEIWRKATVGPGNIRILGLSLYRNGSRSRTHCRSHIIEEQTDGDSAAGRRLGPAGSSGSFERADASQADEKFCDNTLVNHVPATGCECERCRINHADGHVTFCKFDTSGGPCNEWPQ